MPVTYETVCALDVLPPELSVRTVVQERCGLGPIPAPETPQCSTSQDDQARTEQAPQVDHQSPTPFTQEQGSAIKVLFMDAEASLCRLVKEMLTLLGYAATCTQDGLEAIELYHEAQFTEQRFAIVILDLTVAVGYGAREVLPMLRELDPQVRAIVSSGYIYDAAITHYDREGFCGALAKPFTINEIAEVIQQAVHVRNPPRRSVYQ